MTLFREFEDNVDHLKGRLKDTEIRLDHLRKRLVVAEEKENDLKIMLYSILLILTF